MTDVCCRMSKDGLYPQSCMFVARPGRLPVDRFASLPYTPRALDRGGSLRAARNRRLPLIEPSCVSCLRPPGLIVVLLAWSAGLAGCESLFKSAGIPVTAQKLPNLQAPPGSIQLDVVYVERPVGDRLLGRELWQHVDEVAAMDAEGRRLLRQNGLRVGIVGANPPVALQRMLGLKSDFTYEPDAEQAKQLVGRHLFLVSGGETDIQISQPYPECALRLVTEEAPAPLRFQNAVCHFRVRATRLQDGWAQLEFVPQVQHGDDQHRYVVGEAGWRYQTGRETESFFRQRFEVKLGTGDMAVITSEDDSPGSLGQLFFRGPSALRPPHGPESETADREQPPPPAPDNPIQRLLIVRLVGIDDRGAR